MFEGKISLKHDEFHIFINKAIFYILYYIIINNRNY